MTVPNDLLVGYLTVLSTVKLQKLERAIKFALDLP